MNDDFDLNRLADIGDPFAGEAGAPIRAADRSRFPLRAGSPTRSGVQKLRVAALVAALLYEAAWLVFVERRSDLASASPGELAAGIAIPLCAAALALAAATRKGPRGLGAPAARVAALALAAPLLFVIATAVAAPSEAGDPLFWRHAVGCMTVTAVLALGPMALALWAFR